MTTGRVMILGTNGMLGSMLVRRWSRGHRFALFGGVRKAVSGELDAMLQGVLDGLDATAFDASGQSHLSDFIRGNGISVVVNCIGVIKQRAGGQDPVETTAVNALFPHQVANVCGAAKVRMIHISTDCVFAGDRGGYSENDTPDASDFYGRSKALGEVDAPHLTLRTSIIGPELGGAQGLGLLAWFFRQQGPTVPGYDKAIFSGVTTLTLADLIADIVEHHPTMAGLFHVASEPIDKFALLQLVNRVFELGLRVEADSTVRINRSLDASKIKGWMGYVPPAWDIQLRDLAEFMRT